MQSARLPEGCQKASKRILSSKITIPETCRWVSKADVQAAIAATATGAKYDSELFSRDHVNKSIVFLKSDACRES